MDWRRKVAVAILVFPIALACASKPPAPPASSPFVYCPPANFANCTIAKCEPKEDGSGYACDCFLDNRYSATSSASTCIDATATTAQSRFHPVQSYQLCTDSTVSPLWAWCLGVSCTIKPNSTEVVCDCTVPPSGVQRVPYVVVTSTFLPAGCKEAAPGEVWSSATPGDVLQITEFLRQQPSLQGIRNPVVVKKE